MKLTDMTPEQKRTAVAEIAGFKNVRSKIVPWRHQYDKLIVGDSPKNMVSPTVVPDYLHDLNAVHEVVMGLCASEYKPYRMHLEKVCDRSGTWGSRYDATAAQRVDALLLATGRANV